MNDSAEIEARLESLEYKLMELELGHEQLNAVVIAQQALVERQRERIEALTERLRELLDGDDQ